MASIRDHSKGLLALTLFLALTAAVLFSSHGRSIPVDIEYVRIDRLHEFERLSSPSCTELGAGVVALYIEGMDTGLRGVGCQDVVNQRPSITIDFKHVRNRELTDEQDRVVWSRILGHPLETLTGPRPLRYELRWSKDKSASDNLAPEGATVRLVIFEWWAPIAAAAVLLVWGALVYMSATTPLVRDPAPIGSPLSRRTFSLAKVQMAWWFAIVFASFILLWLVTGETPALSGQALSMLGLSSVTTIAAAGISGNRESDDGRVDEFFPDLLSNQDGITIHRFQMLVMTMTLGLVFLIHVARHLTMPELDPSLLTLMGISSATYVGMKIPEQAQAGGDGADAGGTNGAAGPDPKAGYMPTAQTQPALPSLSPIAAPKPDPKTTELPEAN